MFTRWENSTARLRQSDLEASFSLPSRRKKSQLKAALYKRTRNAQYTQDSRMILVRSNLLFRKPKVQAR